MAFRHIPHTADVTIEATAQTLPEVFSEASKAFTAVLTDDLVRSEIEHSIDVSTESLDSALYEYLSALVVLLDAEGFLPASATLQVDRGETVHITGVVRGDSAQHYEHHGDIKAPTYHALGVKQTEHGWVASCTLDL